MKALKSPIGRVFRLSLWIAILALPTTSFAQTGVSISAIGHLPADHAILDINSRTKGVLIPRITTGERMLMANPPSTVLPLESDGLIVFDQTLHQICYWNDAITDWQCIVPDAGSGTGSSGSGAPWTNSWSPLAGMIDATHTVLPNSWSYYYNTIVPQNMSLSEVLMWNDSGSDPLRIAVFRGAASASGPNAGSVLVGQGVDGGVSGPKVFGMTAELGQNLEFVAGEQVCIGFAQGGTTSYMWASDDGPVGNTLAWKNNADLEGGAGFNTNPQTGTPTAIRIVIEFY
jgi:hypothetical protein